MFQLPENWTSFVLRDPAGNTWKSGTGARFVDLSGIPDGRYGLTSPDSSRKYHLIVSKDIPGGALTALPDCSGATSFRFGDAGVNEVFLISILSSEGVLQSSYYVYSPETTITFPPGKWQVVIAKPSQSGFRFSVETNQSGQVETLNRVGLIDDAAWFVKSATFSDVKSPFNYNTGPVVFQFEDAVSPYRVVQVRDPSTGNIGTYFTLQNEVQISVDPGMLEWRVIGIAQETLTYPALFSSLNNIQGGWMSFVQRLPGEKPPVGLSSPADWSGYQINDPSGKFVGGATAESWIDFSQLQSGRYSVVGKLAGGSTSRREVIVSPSIEGGVATIRSTANGTFEILFGEAGSSDPYYVTVKSAAGVDVSASYFYGRSIGLTLGDGDFVVSIARPGQVGFGLSVRIRSGQLDAVNNVRTVDSADWYIPSVDRADPFGPITFNSGLANFSFDASAGDSFVVQLRDPITTNVGTYFTSNEEFAVQIGSGLFEWRAFGIHAQAKNDPQLVSRLTALNGGWTRFTQLPIELEVDYILGLEPDQVQSADQLTLNYPSDAIKLSDGSIVVTNTYAATVEQILPNGQLLRLAGGGREGYVESGVSANVLLRGPTQLFDNGDGKVLFVDSRNLVIREIDLGTGLVRTAFGNPSVLEPTIVNGQLIGLGDIYDIGRDEQGLLYITAAKTSIVGDQLYSDETQVLRQDQSGQWRFWAFDSNFLTRNSFKFVDMLFHDGIVSVLAHDGDKKRYLQYNADGSLKANVEIGSAFGGGLVRDPSTGDLYIGNHTAITRLNPVTLATTNLPFPEPFANVSFMQLKNGRLIITDSDRGRVYEYDLASSAIVKSYGQSTTISNVVVDLDSANGALTMLDNLTPRILSYNDGKISVVAGTGSQSSARLGVNAKNSPFSFPGALATATDGSVYVAESNHRIIKINVDQSTELFAGSLEAGYSGDGGTAVNAKFRSIYGLEVTANGSVLVADSFNHAIRKIAPDGTITTIAGNGTAGLAWTTGPGIAALNTPNRILVTATGRTFISDSWNNRVVELMSDGRLAPIAGFGKFTIYQGSGDFSGDGGIASAAGLNTPTGLAYYEADDTLFIADSFNNRIRYVDSAGNIHTLIGNDRGYAFGSLLNLPNDVELIGDDLYIADTGNALVLKIENADRTGNDLSNSLDIGKAIVRTGIKSRSEYVSLNDLDFYNLTTFTGGSVTVTASEDNLTLDFSNGTYSYYGRQVLNKGQSFTIHSSEHSYFIVSSENKQKYDMSFSNSIGQSSAGITKDIFVESEISIENSSRTTDLMIQAMASFGAESGSISSRYQSLTQSYDFFA